MLVSQRDPGTESHTRGAPASNHGQHCPGTTGKGGVVSTSAGHHMHQLQGRVPLHPTGCRGRCGGVGLQPGSGSFCYSGAQVTLCAQRCTDSSSREEPQPPETSELCRTETWQKRVWVVLFLFFASFLKE